MKVILCLETFRFLRSDAVQSELYIRINCFCRITSNGSEVAQCPITGEVEPATSGAREMSGYTTIHSCRIRSCRRVVPTLVYGYYRDLLGHAETVRERVQRRRPQECKNAE